MGRAGIGSCDGERIGGGEVGIGGSEGRGGGGGEGFSKGESGKGGTKGFSCTCLVHESAVISDPWPHVIQS